MSKRFSCKPSVGGICVDMSKMDRIIEIHGGYLECASRYQQLTVICLAEADSDVVCQPGLRWMDLNETLKKKGKVS